MERFIYIDTAVLGMLLFIVLVCLFGFVLMGCAYLKEVRKNEESNQINKDLRCKLSTFQDKLYKAEFKVPDIDNDQQDIVEKIK